jgi:hypothetical protein
MKEEAVQLFKDFGKEGKVPVEFLTKIPLTLALLGLLGRKSVAHCISKIFRLPDLNTAFPASRY